MPSQSQLFVVGREKLFFSGVKFYQRRIQGETLYNIDPGEQKQSNFMVSWYPLSATLKHHDSSRNVGQG